MAGQIVPLSKAEQEFLRRALQGESASGVMERAASLAAKRTPVGVRMARGERVPPRNLSKESVVNRRRRTTGTIENVMRTVDRLHPEIKADPLARSRLVSYLWSKAGGPDKIKKEHVSEGLRLLKRGDLEEMDRTIETYRAMRSGGSLPVSEDVKAALSPSAGMVDPAIASMTPQERELHRQQERLAVMTQALRSGELGRELARSWNLNPDIAAPFINTLLSTLDIEGQVLGVAAFATDPIGTIKGYVESALKTFDPNAPLEERVQGGINIGLTALGAVGGAASARNALARRGGARAAKAASQAAPDTPLVPADVPEAPIPPIVPEPPSPTNVPEPPPTTTKPKRQTTKPATSAKGQSSQPPTTKPKRQSTKPKAQTKTEEPPPPVQTEEPPAPPVPKETAEPPPAQPEPQAGQLTLLADETPEPPPSTPEPPASAPALEPAPTTPKPIAPPRTRQKTTPETATTTEAPPPPVVEPPPATEAKPKAPAGKSRYAPVAGNAKTFEKDAHVVAWTRSTPPSQTRIARMAEEAVEAASSGKPVLLSSSLPLDAIEVVSASLSERKLPKGLLIESDARGDAVLKRWQADQARKGGGSPWWFHDWDDTRDAVVTRAPVAQAETPIAPAITPETPPSEGKAVTVAATEGKAASGTMETGNASEITEAGTVHADVPRSKGAGKSARQMPAGRGGQEVLKHPETPQEGQVGTQESATPPKKPLSHEDVTRSFERMLERLGQVVPTRVGRIRSRNAAGVYKPHSAVIRVKDAGNIEVVAHEVGHALADRMFGRRAKVGKDTPPPVKEDLYKLGVDLYGAHSGLKDEILIAEGFAELVRKAVVGHDYHRAAPHAARWFDSFLKNQPVLGAEFDNVSKMARAYFAQSPFERATANQYFGPSLPERLDALHELPKKLQRDWIDELQPLFDLDMEARRVFNNLPDTALPGVVADALRHTASARFDYMLHTAMISTNLEVVGPSLAEVLAPLGLSLKERIGLRFSQKPNRKVLEFQNYLWAKHAEHSWVKQNKNPGMSLEDARAIIAEFEPKYKNIAEGYYRWNRALLGYIAEMDPTLAPMLQKWATQNPFYVPLKRHIENVKVEIAEGGSRKRSALGAKPGLLRYRKGSGRAVIDVLGQALIDAEGLMRFAHRRRVLMTIVDIARHVPHLGHLVEPIPANVVRHLVKPNELIDMPKLGKAISSSLGLDAEVSASLIDMLAEIGETPAAIYRQAAMPDSKDPIVMVRIGSKKRWFQVNRRLYDALEGMDPYTLPKTLHLTMAIPTMLVRLGSTGLRPAFATLNAIRDPFTFLMQSQTKTNMVQRLGALLSAYAHALDPRRATGQVTDFFELFYKSGAKMAQPLGLDAMQGRKVLHDTLQGRKVYLATHPIALLREVIGFAEVIPRVAEARLMAAELGWDGKKPLTNAQLYRLLRAMKSVTVDFGASGRYGKQVNQIVAFFNPAVQGMRRMGSAFKRNPRQAVANAIATITAPTLAYWYLNKDKEWYQAMPTFEKYQYWHFELPDGAILRIPRPFEYGHLFATLPEAFIDAAYKENPAVAKEALKHVMRMSTPPLMPTTASIVVEQIKNEDAMYGHRVVPRGEEHKLPGEQWGLGTSKLAIWMGAQAPTVISPRRVDAFVKSLFGGLGYDVLKATGVAGPPREKELTDLPFVGVLFRRGGTHGQTKYMDELYQMHDEAVQKQTALRLPLQRAVRQLGTMRKAMKQAKTSKQVTQIQDKMNAYAKKVVQKLQSVQARKVG